MQEATSGTALLDTLIDGVHTGDNLVLQGGPGAPLALLVDRFVRAASGSTPLVVVNITAPWSGPVPSGTRVVDWSPATTGRASELPSAIAPDATLDDAIRSLEAADEEVGGGAAFVFDPLSDTPTSWGPDAALEIFLATCPRLYRRRSLAVWPIEADHHRPAFLRRLAEVTQVVVELQVEAAELQLTVRKADGRRPEVIGRSVRATVAEGDLRAGGQPVNTRERLGGAIREQRLARGLSQTEVARRVGITPSALSQVERGVRGPSGDTLVRLWEVLDVPFGPTEVAGEHGYHVSRRSGRDRVRLQDGLEGERLLEGSDGSATWSLVFAAGAVGTRTPFAVKAVERVVVLRGVLDVQLGTRSETLHEGDALEVVDTAVAAWANPGPRPTEVLWSIAGAR